MEWFKRKFSFDLPIEMFPNVVERVRGTPARLEELTRGLSREELTHRDGDKWSIQEQAGHLLDLEELGMNRLDDFEANGAPGEDCELTEVATVLVGGGELHERWSSLVAARAPLSRAVQR